MPVWRNTNPCISSINVKVYNNRPPNFTLISILQCKRSLWQVISPWFPFSSGDASRTPSLCSTQRWNLHHRPTTVQCPLGYSSRNVDVWSFRQTEFPGHARHLAQAVRYQFSVQGSCQASTVFVSLVLLRGPPVPQSCCHGNGATTSHSHWPNRLAPEQGIPSHYCLNPTQLSEFCCCYRTLLYTHLKCMRDGFTIPINVICRLVDNIHDSCII